MKRKEKKLIAPVSDGWFIYLLYKTKTRKVIFFSALCLLSSCRLLITLFSFAQKYENEMQLDKKKWNVRCEIRCWTRKNCLFFFCLHRNFILFHRYANMGRKRRKNCFVLIFSYRPLNLQTDTSNKRHVKLARNTRRTQQKQQHIRTSSKAITKDKTQHQQKYKSERKKSWEMYTNKEQREMEQKRRRREKRSDKFETVFFQDHFLAKYFVFGFRSINKASYTVQVK